MTSSAGVTLTLGCSIVDKSLDAGDLASGVEWTRGRLRWSGKSPTTGFSLAAAVILPEDAGSSCADLQPR